ncbi:MAG: glycoside hydrolase family 2 TIM barrel-domain containing protein, partial [Gemmatimonadaceae bacterium]
MTDSTFSRRDAIKTGVVALVGASLTPDSPARFEPSAAPAFASPTAAAPHAAVSSRTRTLLDDDWRFHLGHASDPKQDFGYGAQSEFAKSGRLFAPVSRADFDVSAWTTLDLPHDWLVDLPFVNDASLADYGFKPVGRAYPATSIGWYRRMLDIPADRTTRCFRLEFDGVFRDCLVSLNGHMISRNFSGYAPFSVDITPNVNRGEPNVLVVRVNATEHEGWFYEGAGIYRHVWLVVTAPVHVAHWGTFVTTTRDGQAAIARVVSAVQNDGDADARCRVEANVVDADGSVVSTTRSAETAVGAGRSAEVAYQLRITAPRLWSPESPHCYTLVTRVMVDGTEVDRTETAFGVRTVRFDPARGFLLNGTRVEIKGTCNHQDHAGVGSALPDRLQSYRIERLKAMGANAYRTSHNPPTPELLDACDRLGMMVLDETRMFGSDSEALSQVERLVRRDRNHASVIAWSIANEEQNEQGNARGAAMAAVMKRAVTQLDPSRAVTAAMDGSWGKGISGVVDVQGFNYHIGAPMDDFH